MRRCPVDNCLRVGPMGQDARMALRLDPTRPLVWRTPFSLQVGVEPPVIVLDDLSASDEVVIELVRAGVTRAMLDDAAALHGWDRVRVETLLERLSPALLDGAPAHLPRRDIIVDGTPPDAAALCALLVALGAEVSIGVDAAWDPSLAHTSAAGTARRARGASAASGAVSARRVAVVLSHYVVSPRAAATWLRADVPHLLVRFGDRAIRVGPLVTPGAGPCAACLELQHTDRDAAWPAMSAQLARRRAPSADPFGLAMLAPVVARILNSPDGGWSSRVLRLRWRAGAGEIDPQEWIEELDPVSPHPRCGCLSPPGNATAPELPSGAIRPPTRTATRAPSPA